MNHNDLEKLAREALERAGKAGNVPWEYLSYADGDDEVFYSWSVFDPTLGCRMCESNDATWHDAGKFIAHSRSDVPTLAQAVLDLIAENKRLQDEVKDIGTAAYLYAKHEGRDGNGPSAEEFDSYFQAVSGMVILVEGTMTLPDHHLETFNRVHDWIALMAKGVGKGET